MLRVILFKLSAKISSDQPAAIEAAVKAFVGDQGFIRTVDGGFEVEAQLEGDSARELNRELLSSLRRCEKRTRLRAEWTSGDVSERFFDYVPKGRKPSR